MLKHACKGSVFLQFCDKIQSSMHQIFTQMYLAVSIIGQSQGRDPHKIFIKKLFFRYNGHPIFMLLYHPLSIFQNKSRRHMNPVINNKLHQHQPSSVRVKSPHKQDLLINTSKISHCLLQLHQIIKS